MEIFETVLWNVWATLLDLAPFLLLGFLLSGAVHGLIPRVGIRKAFGKPGLGSVTRASLFGIPLPLCSCGVVPAAFSLRDQGASRGATIAFLITTPETGVDSVLVSAALLDPLLMVFRPVAALITGIAAGFAEDSFDRPVEEAEGRGAEACGLCHDEGVPFGTPHHHRLGERLRTSFRYAFRDLFDDIVGWVLLGVLISAVITTALPEDLFRGALGSETAQFLSVLVIGMPLYICASASTPIAASLILAGMSPGAALVLLLVGPATNAATILLVLRKLGRRAAGIYIGSIAGVSLALGLLLNRLYPAFGLDPKAQIGAARGWCPHELQLAAVSIFLALLALSLYRRLSAWLAHHGERG